MKHLFTFLSCIAFTLTAYAQVGPGITFEYSPIFSGYRVVREYKPLASLQKPGKDVSGNPADTVIGYLPGEEKNEVLEEKIFVRAYPNPMRDILFIENLSWQEGGSATLKIYDVSGKLITEKSTTQAKEVINMQALPPGTYHVKYYTNFTYLISWQIAKI